MNRRITRTCVLFVAWVIATQVTVEAFGALIVAEPQLEETLASTGMSPQDEECVPRNDSDPEVGQPTAAQAALPGTGAPSVSVTTTFAGHASIVAPAVVPPPALVGRLMGESKLIFPEPPPLGLLRIPKCHSV